MALEMKDKRIASLDAQLAEANRQIDVLKQINANDLVEYNRLAAKLARYEKGLREIAEHPDRQLGEGSVRSIAQKDGYGLAGFVEGVRECAAIATRALKGEE